MKDIFFRSNLEIFSKKYPDISKRLSDTVDIMQIEIASAADGGICYVVKNDNGKFSCVSNPNNPIESAQKSINALQHRLSKGLSPAVVVGLAPGYVFDIVYKHFKSRLKFNEPFRRIYVIIDSLYCLAAWLGSSSRTEELNNEFVEFYWHEDVSSIVNACKNDPQRSHLFIPVSEFPENVVNQIINPLAQFYLEREDETKKLLAANNEYYDSLDDNTLSEIIAGKAGRKPRLMMPTHSSSNVVQYSTRDTCEAFRALGWETFILNVERDLPPWRMAKTINDFKPDLFIFINHLRTEDENVELYPRNILFITWIQDAMSAINNRAAADKWNAAACKNGKRDFLTGYTEQLKKFGYDPSRLFPCGMIVNTNIFKAADLTAEEKEKYGCDVCFASNRSRQPLDMLNDLIASFEHLGFNAEVMQQIYERMKVHYEKGLTLTSYNILKDFLLETEVFRKLFEKCSPDEQNNIIERIFWDLNDVFYRHIVLKWISETDGIKLNIYGKDWDKNPEFGKYAKGSLAHGEELSKAYRAARYCLHLNALEGAHQRLSEIMACGATPLTRINFKYDNNVSDELNYVLNWLRNQIIFFHHDDSAKCKINETLSVRQYKMLSDWIFNISLQITYDFSMKNNEKADCNFIASELMKLSIDNPISLISLLSSSANTCFNDKKSLSQIIKPLSDRVQDEHSSLSTKFKWERDVTKTIMDAIFNFLKRKDIIEPSKIISSIFRNIAELTIMIIYKAPFKDILSCFKQLKYPGNDIKIIVIQHYMNCCKTSDNKDLDSEINAIFKSMDNSELEASYFPFLIEFMVKSGNIDRAICLLNSSKLADAAPGVDAIGMHLQYVSLFLYSGDRSSAERIIHNIDPEKIDNQGHINNLCLCYIRLYKFDDARRVFETAIRKNLTGEMFYFYKGLYHYCLWELDKVEECIVQDRNRYKGNPDNLLEVLLKSREGLHDEALIYVDKMLDGYTLNVDLRIEALLSKADILRSCLNFDAALKCYITAENMSPKSFSAWLMFFEHSMTMLFLGNEEDALRLSTQGLAMVFPNFNSRYNPCRFLNKFILHCRDTSNKEEFLTDSMIDDVLACPFPYIDYRAWMMLFIAVELDDRRDSEKVGTIIYRLISDPTITCPAHRDSLKKLFSELQSCRDPQFVDALAVAMWPHHSADSYKHKILKKIMT